MSATVWPGTEDAGIELMIITKGPRGCGFVDRRGAIVWPTVARQVFRYTVRWYFTVTGATR